MFIKLKAGRPAFKKYCEGVGSGATTTKGQGRSLPYHIYGTAKSGIGAKRPAKKER
jgi:hypothetical protein